MSSSCRQSCLHSRDPVTGPLLPVPSSASASVENWSASPGRRPQRHGNGGAENTVGYRIHENLAPCHGSRLPGLDVSRRPVTSSGVAKSDKGLHREDH
jgi:hypothetical protein